MEKTKKWEGGGAGRGTAGERKDWRRHDKEGKKSCLGLFKLGDAQSLLLALPTCISGSLETFKLHL